MRVTCLPPVGFVLTTTSACDLRFSAKWLMLWPQVLALDYECGFGYLIKCTRYRKRIVCLDDKKPVGTWTEPVVCARGSVGRVTAYGARGCGFDSQRRHAGFGLPSIKTAGFFSISTHP